MIIALTSRNSAQDLKQGFLAVVSVDQPTNHGIKQDDKDSPQSGQEEEHFSSVWHLTSSVIHRAPDDIEKKKRCQTHGSIELAMSKVFQRVDNDSVSRSSRVKKITDAHQRRHLTNGNVEGRTCHESRDGGQGNEVNDPPAADQADKADNRAGNEGKR